MPTLWRKLLPPLLALSSSVAGPAFAQKVSGAAEALFAEGRVALEKGDYPTACAKFTESYEMSKALGPLLNLAECQERRGQLASALDRWKQGVSRLEEKPGDERMPLAKEHVASLEARVPRLTLKLVADAAAGVAARLDDRALGSLPVEALPIDPGDHRITVSAPGYEEQQLRVTLAVGERKELAVGGLQKINGGASVPPPPPPPDGGGSRRTVGFIVAGIGVVGFIGFGVTGGLMLAKSSVVEDHCDKATRRCDSAEGVDAAAAGRSLGAVNAVALGVGVAGVGVGAILILTSGGKSGQTALGTTPLPGGAGFSVRRTF